MNSLEQTTSARWNFLESEMAPDRFKKAATLVYDRLQNSDIPEELTHAESTRKWMLALNPKANEILQLAALSHDIERSNPNRLKRDQFENIGDYKNEHAKIGAKIASEIVQSAGYNADQTSRLYELIANHEKGGTDPNIQLLTDADSLSFFENNLLHYLERNGADETNKKVKFMHSRMSDRAKKLLIKLSETNKLIADILNN